MEITVRKHLKVSIMNDLGIDKEFCIIADIWLWEGEDKHPALQEVQIRRASLIPKESPLDQH